MSNMNNNIPDKEPENALVASTPRDEQQNIELLARFRNKKLQNCLKSIYESTRIATEITGLNKKRTSLDGIRKTLEAGDNVNAASLEQMSDTISGLDTAIRAKHNEMEQVEQRAITSFIEVMSSVADNSQSSGKAMLDKVQNALRAYSQQTYGEFQKKQKNLIEQLSQLEANKMGASDKDELLNMINSLRTDLSKDIKANHDASINHSNESIKRVLSTLGSTITKLEGKIKNEIDNEMTAKLTTAETNIRADLTTKLNEGTEILDASFTEKNKVIKNAMFAYLEQKIPGLVKTSVDTNLSPTYLFNIIQQLPEFKVLQEQAQKADATINVDPENLPNFEAVKNSIALLTRQLTELKQSNHQTRAIVDTMRVPPPPQDANQLDHAVAVKRMEEMERQVTVIHNNIKMIETMVNLKATAIENNEVVGTSGKKRARSEVQAASSPSTAIDVPSSGAVTAETTTLKEEYLARLAEVENKHQKLLDFILQCKDTVLDDLFPTRLEAAMQKIEQVLLNHERFISFLIDPFTTTSKHISIPSAPAEAAATLNPAMIDAIQQLVKSQAEEIALPLHKKIKLLEEKLEARSQQ